MSLSLRFWSNDVNNEWRRRPGILLKMQISYLAWVISDPPVACGQNQKDSAGQALQPPNVSRTGLGPRPFMPRCRLGPALTNPPVGTDEPAPAAPPPMTAILLSTSFPRSTVSTYTIIVHSKDCQSLLLFRCRLCLSAAPPEDCTFQQLIEA